MRSTPLWRRILRVGSHAAHPDGQRVDVMGSIEIYLYGHLQRGMESPVLRPWISAGETVTDVLHRIGIDPEEVGHIFLNHRLLLTHSSMAPWLGYQVETEHISEHHRGWDAPVRPGDRLGVFPRQMGLLVI